MADEENSKREEDEEASCRSRATRMAAPLLREEPEGLPTEELTLLFGRYAFAHSWSFWRGMCWSAAWGAALGLVALGYMQLITWLPQRWQGEHYASDAAQVCLGCGKPWWVGLCAGGGLLVGLIRFRCMPAKPEGMVQEIARQRVDPGHAPWVAVLCVLSLGCGASVGPEAGLCSLGGAVAAVCARLRNRLRERCCPALGRMTEREERMNTITGICAMLGSLLPSPFLAVSLISELGGPQIFQHYLESTAHAAVAATASFATYQAVVDKTTLRTLRLPLSVNDLEDIQHFKPEYYLYAMLLGLVGAGVAMLILALFAICGKIFQRVTARSRYAIVLLCTLTGALVGVSGYLLPLTFGDGSEQLGSLVGPLSNCGPDCYSEPRACGQARHQAPLCHHLISTELLIGTALLKIVTFALSSNLGFVGGIILPNVFIGVAGGVLAHRVAPQSLPIWLSVSCMAAAVPGSLAPAPVTMTILPTLMFVFNGQQIAPVFLSVVVGYCTMHLILLGPVVKMAGGTSCPHKAFGELPGSPHRSGDSSLHGEHVAPDEADPESAGGGTS